MIVANGNILRIIRRVIGRLSVEEMLAIELPTAHPVAYHLGRDLSPLRKLMPAGENPAV
ncbi:bisphosphoglycerate-dependent phosphoglycerate mutase [Agrobacterium tumefaciens]|nr:bisphosphoglycerate-dependent phosphoglycerate mutase [Agrobacterium radiobacter]MBB5589008.1 bisphosphoglycerate-dependent phosphoglycerate mutase [Agrobacterium radiobacter]